MKSVSGDLAVGKDCRVSAFETRKWEDFFFGKHLGIHGGTAIERQASVLMYGKESTWIKNNNG